MKFNVYFKIWNDDVAKGGEIPNNTNPIECANLASLLAQLATNLPKGNSVAPFETIGIRVEKAG